MNISLSFTKTTHLTDEPYFILLRAYVWAANTDDAFAIQCDMNYSVKKRFYVVGVEIPFPYRNVIVKKEYRCIVETKS